MPLQVSLFLGMLRWKFYVSKFFGSLFEWNTVSENVLVHSIVPHHDKTMKMQNPKCPGELIIITACLRAFSNNVKVDTKQCLQLLLVTCIQKKNSIRSTPKYTCKLYSGGFLFRSVLICFWDLGDFLSFKRLVLL